MKGPEAKRARPLAERFADLESRINALRARHSATPQEHTVADLVNDLRARCDVVRSHLAGGPPEGTQAHDANRGTGATWASRKDISNPPGDREGGAPKDRSNTSDSVHEASDRETPGAVDTNPDHKAEAAYRDLEEAYEKALMRFRG